MQKSDDEVNSCSSATLHDSDNATGKTVFLAVSSKLQDLTNMELSSILSDIGGPVDAVYSTTSAKLNHRPLKLISEVAGRVTVRGTEFIALCGEFRADRFLLVLCDCSSPVLDNWWFSYRQFSKIVRECSLLWKLVSEHSLTLLSPGKTLDDEMQMYLGTFASLVSRVARTSDSVVNFVARSRPLSLKKAYFVPGVDSFVKHSAFMVAALASLQDSSLGFWLKQRSLLLGAQLVEILSSAERTKVVDPITATYLRNYVVALMVEVNSFTVTVTPKPVVVLLQGNPGVGKTSYVFKLMKAFGFDQNEIYFRKSQADHGRWNGYSGQAVTIFDDVFQGGAAKVQNDFMELCTTLGTQTVSGALLSEKNSKFISPFIFVTCNECNFGRGVNVEAFKRRVDLWLNVSGSISKRVFSVEKDGELQYRMDETQTAALLLTAMLETERWNELYSSSVEDSVVPDWAFYSKDYYLPTVTPCKIVAVVHLCTSATPSDIALSLYNGYEFQMKLGLISEKMTVYCPFELTLLLCKSESFVSVEAFLEKFGSACRIFVGDWYGIHVEAVDIEKFNDYFGLSYPVKTINFFKSTKIVMRPRP